MIFPFGGLFAWISIPVIAFGHLVIPLVAKYKLTRRLGKPLAALCLVCSVYTVINGLAFLNLWDVSSYFELLSEHGEVAGKVATSGRGRAGILLFIVGVWPYASIVIGGWMAIPYYVFFKNIYWKPEE